MNIENQKITLDIKQRNMTACYGIKGDIGTRIVDIYITQGEAIVDLTGVQVLLYALTPNEDKLYHDIAITNAKLGKLTFTIPQQILQQKDMTTCCLVFREGQKQLISYEFFVQVTDSIYNENAIITGDDFSALNVALNKVEQYDKELQDASTNLEHKYTVRLNEFDAQLDHIEGKSNTSTKSKKPLVVFISDDTKKEDLSVLVPLFEAKGVPCSFACITDRVDVAGSTSLTTAELREVVARGHGMMSHSHTHREMSSLTKEQLEVEFTENQKRYKEIFGKEAEAIAYPYGMWNEDVIEIARKYFDYAFSTIKDGYLLNDDVLEQYAIVRDVVTYEMGAKPRTLANMKPLIDRCKAENKLLIYCIHASEFAGQYATNQTVLNEVIDYIKSIGIQIVNHDVALAEKGNVFDVGTFNTEYVKISKSGAIKSSRNINLDEYTPPPLEGFNFNTTKVVAIDTPITELPLGISFNIVRNAQASSFPLGRSGTIITYHSLTDSDYNFQLYYPFGLTDGFYKRNWNKWSNPKNWSSFIEFKPSTIIKREVAGNFGSLAPNAQQSLDLDFTGAKVNDNVIVNFKSSPPKGILISSMISQANKVRIVLMNFDTANVDLTNAIFNVSVVS